MTQNYDVIIVGGGIVGCAIAYHVARDTSRSVCLLEKGQLTSGTTWHAAGLVAELRASPNLTRLAKYSGQLYAELTRQGEPTGFKRVGALTLARSASRQFELQKQAAMARASGIDCTWHCAAAIAERWPHILTEDLLGGLYMPNDGQTNPVDVRAEVALFDQTSFAKYAVAGEDACAYLNHLSTADLNVPVGRVVYCQWLNPDGGIEADVTITRVDTDTYWVISAAASRARDLHWMQRHRADYAVSITDITLDHAVIGIMGPEARTRLQALTDTSLAAEDFAFGTSQLIKIAGVNLRATRITYVGALGWELYVPWNDAQNVYAAITHRPIVHAGYHAMDSLRLEKGYRHWGHDITEEDTPIEAGLGFTVAWDKPGGFIGQDALRRQKLQGVTKRLALFRLQDGAALLTHDEPIWCEHQIVGQVCSAAYSFTYDCTLATGYISSDTPLNRTAIEAAQYQIEVADKKIDATASLRGWYDPQNLEIQR